MVWGEREQIDSDEEERLFNELDELMDAQVLQIILQTCSKAKKMLQTRSVLLRSGAMFTSSWRRFNP